MMIVHADEVFAVPAGTSPDYEADNPVLQLMALVERCGFACEREQYLSESLQYLFPFSKLELYGPQAPNESVFDPRAQDDKNDFQKQNVRRFVTGDTQLVRGFVAAGDWIGPFLRVSYRGGPDSLLSRASGHTLGEHVRLYLRVGAIASPTLIDVPYVESTDRYEVELWGFPGNDLASLLGPKGRAALASGELQVRPDLLKGSAADLRREAVDDRDMRSVAPGHAMHPTLPLHLELAWSDDAQNVWDSQDGANYHYEFSMKYRGWDHYLRVGTSGSPHGGVGVLEYRNLFSNYFGFAGSGELARDVAPWSFDAFGRKAGGREEFMALDYMDLHIVKAGCGIGLHRHRDNQEAFMLLEGQAVMVVGDWCKMPERERCFELRLLRPGHLALLKGGQLHGLVNPTDEDAFLFMFGGYD